MSGSDARGRIHQSEAFRVTEVTGRTIDALWSASERPENVEMVFLKLRGLPWQRFCLSVGLGIWEEWSDAETFEHYEAIPRTDFGLQCGVIGHRLLRAECIPSESDRAAKIVLDIEAWGRLELRPTAPHDGDPDATFVRVETPCAGKVLAGSGEFTDDSGQTQLVFDDPRAFAPPPRLHLRCNTVPYRQGFIEVFDGAHPGLVNLETWEVQADVVLSGVASVADLADDRAVRTNTELELTPAEARSLAAALLAAADAAER